MNYLYDIEIVTDNTGSTPKVQALICKNTDPNSLSPTISPSSSSNNNNQDSSGSPAMTADDCSTLAQTGLRGENKMVITGVRTLAECCYKCKNSNECEVAEFKESEEKCELHRSYSVDNEVANQSNSTLIGKQQIHLIYQQKLENLLRVIQMKYLYLLVKVIGRL